MGYSIDLISHLFANYTILGNKGIPALFLTVYEDYFTPQSESLSVGFGINF